jgi:hypothetical protein
VRAKVVRGILPTVGIELLEIIAQLRAKARRQIVRQLLALDAERSAPAMARFRARMFELEEMLDDRARAATTALRTAIAKPSISSARFATSSSSSRWARNFSACCSAQTWKSAS